MSICVSYYFYPHWYYGLLEFSNTISIVLYDTGSFGEWMSCHPESLGCAIPLLLQGIGNPEVAMPATMALKDVTRENLDHIQPYIQQILQASKVRGLRHLNEILGQFMRFWFIHHMSKFTLKSFTPYD